MTSPATTVTTVAEGVARIAWAADLQDEGLTATIEVVRREVEAALVAHVRVETLVSPDDEQAQRVARVVEEPRAGVGQHRADLLDAALGRDEPAARVDDGGSGRPQRGR